MLTETVGSLQGTRAAHSCPSEPKPAAPEITIEKVPKEMRSAFYVRVRSERAVKVKRQRPMSGQRAGTEAFQPDFSVAFFLPESCRQATLLTPSDTQSLFLATATATPREAR